jgi:hypothetical protein
VDIYSIANQLRLDRDIKPSEELVDNCVFIGLDPEKVIIKARLVMFLVLITSVLVLSLTIKNYLAIIASIALSLFPGLIQ